MLFNLDPAIECEKGVLDIGVHRKLENFVATLLVMRIFSGFLGASRACAYFRDSTAECRFNVNTTSNPSYELHSSNSLMNQKWLTHTFVIQL